MAYTVSVEVHVVTEQACGGCVSTAPGPATGRALSSPCGVPGHPLA